MLVDALLLLLGGRADSGAIRPGASRAVIEGGFEAIPPAARVRAEALGLDAEEGRLVVRREVSAEGRSRAWVNGSPTTASVLAELGALLVDVHGQHETDALLRAGTQRELLDAFAGAGAERETLAQAVARLRELGQRETALAARRAEVERRADWLRHVVHEIDAARIHPGEEDALDQEARRLGHVGQLGEAANRLVEALDGEEAAALRALHEAARALGQLERIDPGTAEWRALLDQAYVALQELAGTVREYAGGLEEDPARLAQVEARRDVLHRLKQKHGGSLPAVLATRRQAGEELDLLDTADLDLQAIAAERVAAHAAVQAAAAALTARRSVAAKELSEQVSRLLPRLGLVGGRLRVALEPLAEPAAYGAEEIAMRVVLNTGMEERPLARVASGGELSRLMLALRAVLARQDATPTLVFDEVDQGIGGDVAARVGEALARVAARHQVLVITHHPQIAARADRHLVAAKRSRSGIATSEVGAIHGEDRVTELARMLGAPEGEAARRHAAELLRGPG
jgi:DNA repair protein RecN (Recombination protein N)